MTAMTINGAAREAPAPRRAPLIVNQPIDRHPTRMTINGGDDDL
ncbi:MAG TPA: hypothetical protein VF116_13425 [Ktedonobacterales bacterium]